MRGSWLTLLPDWSSIIGTNWIFLGDPCHGLRSAVQCHRHSGRGSTPSWCQEERIDYRMGCFQRGTVLDVHRRHVSLSLGIVFCILLRQSFQSFHSIVANVFYLPQITVYGRQILHLSPGDSLNLLITMNAVGILGRIIPAFIADKFFGSFNTLIPFMAGVGIMVSTY